MMTRFETRVCAVAVLLASTFAAGCKDGVQSRAHFYAAKDGTEYGYELAVTDEMKARGQVAAPLQMFRYLGQKGDTYQLYAKEGELRQIAECSRPCDIAKIYSFFGYTFVNRQMMQLPQNALLSYVFADAANGKLDPWVALDAGQAVRYWVDGEKNQLVATPEPAR